MNQTLLDGLAPQAFTTLLERLLAIADDAVVITDSRQRVVLFNDGIPLDDLRERVQQIGTQFGL